MHIGKQESETMSLKNLYIASPAWNLDKLGKEADQTLMKFSKGKYKVLKLDRSSTMLQCMLVASWKAAVGRQAEHKPAMSPFRKDHQHPWLH